MKIACVGLMWTLLQNERQRRHVARLRPGRNLFQGPIVSRRGRQPQSEVVGKAFAERRVQYGHYYRLMEELRLEDGSVFAEDTPHVRIKHRAITAGTSRHRVKRRTFFATWFFISSLHLGFRRYAALYIRKIVY